MVSTPLNDKTKNSGDSYQDTEMNAGVLGQKERWRGKSFFLNKG
jgi:hypothetical protein